MSDQPQPETPNGVPEVPESADLTPAQQSMTPDATDSAEAPHSPSEPPNPNEPAGSGPVMPPQREIVSLTPLPADPDSASEGSSPLSAARVKAPRPLIDAELSEDERPDLPERRTKFMPQERPPQNPTQNIVQNSVQNSMQKPPLVPTPQPVEKSQPVAKLQPVEKPRAGSKSQPAPKSQPVPKAPPAERYTLVTFVSALRALSLTFAAAVIVSTIFMIFTSPDFLSAGTRQELGEVRATAEHVAEAPTALPTPVWFKRVGVVAGHSGIATYGPTRGNVDTGAVCPDGFTEASVTLKVAQQVVAALQGRGYTVDLMGEFDLKLDNFQAAAFISLHADSCDNFDDGFNHSGFKVAYPVDRLTVRDQDLRLNDCIRDNYGPVTGLPFTPGGITDAMTRYHAFHLSNGHPGIAVTTPGVILELGLLNYDRDLLQNHADKAAKGIVNGLLCYLDPTGQPSVPAVAPATIAPDTPVPTAQ